MTQPVPPTPGSVVVSWLHGTDVAAAFTTSLVDLLAYDMNHLRRITGRIEQYSGVNISSARNANIREFLDHHDAEWLWMLDSDMVVPPNALDQLLAVADPDSAPIVGGLCFGATDGQLWPTMYHLAKGSDGPHWVRYVKFPINSLVKVPGTGAACLLVHRSALERIEAKFAGPYTWFQESSMSGEPMGEDLTFCLQAGTVGLPIHVHTGVYIGHVKTQILTFDKYAEQMRVADSLLPPVDAADEAVADA